nr:immunoglobulin light chain junction region [Macaca mulatta]MOV72303.1 immunoglobulin light chain junction region [Macaca mulatta]MOV72497.1 immunoglobulin light chain junction region [Macaca mulatta]MOV72659.1 immunoglobulin light chain junction region [Macaca mulatta]MOV72917.1 immunoglobulin light chain junction region [Macaca mulatta]
DYYCQSTDSSGYIF